MIVSMAMAVLPVCRSPMISCRWPRPIAVIASMALIPVCSGSFTGWRSTTDGAWSPAAQLGVLDRALAVQRLAQRPDHAAEEAVADGHGQDLAGAADLLALLDLVELAEDDDADLADVQVERQAPDAVLELEQLVGHGRGQPLDPGDAVTALGDGADLFPEAPAGSYSSTKRASASRISSGRIVSSAIVLPVFPFVVLLAGGRGHRSARQLAPDLGQPAGRGPVNKLIPDLDGNSTHDRGIKHDIEVNACARRTPASVSASRLRWARGQLDRRPHHRDQLLLAPRRDAGAHVQGQRQRRPRGCATT
jgi:hypothetical protein